MTPDEAIKTNKDTRAFHLLRKEYNAAEAIQLGNEALEELNEKSTMTLDETNLKCCLSCLHCKVCPIISGWIDLTESPIETTTFYCSEWKGDSGNN